MNTQNAIISVTSGRRIIAKRNPPRSKGESKKEKWTRPVSKAFYEKLCRRCEQIFEDLRYGHGWVRNFMPVVDRYLSTGEMPGQYDNGIMTVFICLRHEIDMALERSAKARKRAAERRNASEKEESVATAGEAPDEETALTSVNQAEAPLSTPPVKAVSQSQPPDGGIRNQKNNREESS